MKDGQWDLKNRKKSKQKKEMLCEVLVKSGIEKLSFRHQLRIFQDIGSFEPRFCTGLEFGCNL